MLDRLLHRSVADTLAIASYRLRTGTDTRTRTMSQECAGASLVNARICHSSAPG